MSAVLHKFVLNLLVYSGDQNHDESILNCKLNMVNNSKINGETSMKILNLNSYGS